MYTLLSTILIDINLISEEPHTNIQKKNFFLEKKPRYIENFRFNSAFNCIYGPNFHGQRFLKHGPCGLFFTESSLSKLARYYFRDGNSFRSRTLLLKSFNFFYTSIVKSYQLGKLGLDSKTANLNQIFYNVDLHNPNTLFNLWVTYYQQLFALKVINSSKKSRKKRNPKNTISCIQIPPKAQANCALRSFHFFTDELPFFKANDRIKMAIFESFSKFNSGVLYNRRIKIYNRALRQHRMRRA